MGGPRSAKWDQVGVVEVMKYYAGIGSRKTPDDVLVQMVAIARDLRRRGYTLRSGGAPKADTAFERGSGEDNEIYLPWAKFNDHPRGIVIKGMRWRQAAALSAKYHPAWGRLSRGGRMLHTRNVFQVLGPELNQPAEFIVCWTENGRLEGGTAQALRIAMDPKWDIPIFNLGRSQLEGKRLMKWLDGKEG